MRHCGLNEEIREKKGGGRRNRRADKEAWGVQIPPHATEKNKDAVSTKSLGTLKEGHVRERDKRYHGGRTVVLEITQKGGSRRDKEAKALPCGQGKKGSTSSRRKKTK